MRPSVNFAVLTARKRLPLLRANALATHASPATPFSRAAHENSQSLPHRRLRANVVPCASLSVLVQAQAGTIPKRSNDMTKQKTPAAPFRARATRTVVPNDTTIRPFHVQIPDEALA